MFDRNGVDTIMLVETVLSAIELAKQGKITSPFDEGSEDFAAVCADIANKAIEKYGEEDENGILNGWDVVYEVADAELIKEYGMKGEEKDMSSNMMEQLMAEIKKVNELNVQVDKIVADRKAEKRAERKKVAEHIGQFLELTKQVMIKADVTDELRIEMPFCCNGCSYVLRFSKRFQHGEFFIKGYEDMWKDGHASLYYYPLSIIPQCDGGKVWANVCDSWSKGAEDVIENAVAKAVKARLAERMAEMTNALKEEA